MTASLILHDMWPVVGPEVVDTIPCGVRGVKETQRKRAEAMTRITLFINTNQLPFIAGIMDPHTAWNKLQDIHHSLFINTIILLCCCFFSMQKTETESAQLFMSHVLCATFELSNFPALITELDQILVITTGLPLIYRQVVNQLDNISFSDLNLATVMSRILSFKTQLNGKQDTSESALVARKGLWSWDITCLQCHGHGHIASACGTAFGTTQAAQSQGASAKITEVEETSEGNVIALSVYVGDSKNVWPF